MYTLTLLYIYFTLIASCSYLLLYGYSTTDCFMSFHPIGLLTCFITVADPLANTGLHMSVYLRAVAAEDGDIDSRDSTINTINTNTTNTCREEEALEVPDTFHMAFIDS